MGFSFLLSLLSGFPPVSPPCPPPGRCPEWCGRAEGAAAEAPVCQCVCPSLLHCLPPPLPPRLPSPPRTAQPPDRCGGRAGGLPLTAGPPRGERGRRRAGAVPQRRGGSCPGGRRPRAAAGQRRAGGRGAGPCARRPWRVRAGIEGVPAGGNAAVRRFVRVPPPWPAAARGEATGRRLLSPLEAPRAPGRAAPGRLAVRAGTRRSTALRPGRPSLLTPFLPSAGAAFLPFCGVGLRGGGLVFF